MGRERQIKLNGAAIAADRNGRPILGWLLILHSGLFALTAVPAHSAPARQDAATQQALQALRKAQGALRQLSQEKTQLEADKTALQDQVGKLDATVKQLEPLKGEVEQQKAAVEALKNANTGLEGQLAAARQREQQLHDKIKEIVGQAKLIQGDNRLLVEAVKEREHWIEQCTQKNNNMASDQAELLQLYQDKGFWDKVGDLEPFTGIGKVRTENVVQDYQFKLEDLKVTPFQSSAEAAGKSEAEAPTDQQADPHASPEEEDGE